MSAARTILLSLLVLSSQYAAAAVDPPADEATAQCHRAKMAMAQKATDLAGQHRNGCRVNSDCTLVSTSLSCQESCPLAILASGRASYEKALRATESESCASQSNKCRVGFLCAPAEGALCFEGRCVVNLKGVPLRRQEDSGASKK
jgi:hypothetical protein